MKRIVGWSTGTVGKHVIAGVAARPEQELVGVWVSNPEKVGQDVGQIAGLGKDLGVKATTNKAELYALKPDAVVHTAMADDRLFEAIEDIIEIMEQGINVVSSGPVLLCFPDKLGLDEIVDRINQVGARTGASLFVNGIDPGFANDVLPLVTSSICQRIDELRVSEIADYSTYYQPVVMADLFGFGKPLDFPALMWQPGILTTAWGPVVRQLAAGLGVELDPELKEVVEPLAAAQQIKTVSVDIEPGTLAAVRFEVQGLVNGVPRIVLEHVTRTDQSQAPDWPQPATGGGCYRVEFKGEPNMVLDLTHHGENGDHNDSGMITTAMRLVNSVDAVCAAPGGLVFAKDLPLYTGRGLVTK